MRFLLVSVLMLSFFFSSYTAVYAVSLYEQLIRTDSSGTARTAFSQNFGTNGVCGTQFTGSFDAASFWINADSNSGSLGFEAFAQTGFGSSLTTYTSDTIMVANQTGAPVEVVFDFSTPVDLTTDCIDTFASSLVWRIGIRESGQSAGGWRVWGSDSDVFANSSINSSGTNDLEDMAFILEETFVYNTTRIDSQNEPTPGEVTDSTTVTIDFDYYWNDTENPTINSVGVIIRNVITGNTAFIEEAPTAGLNNFNETIELVADQQYTWSPFLSSESGLVIQTGATQPAQQFFTVSNPYEGQGVDLGTLGTSTATSTNAFASFYQGLSNTVRNNPPFEAVFNTIDLFENVSTSTAAVTLSLPQGIRDNITDPVKSGIGWLLVIMYGIFTINRLLKFNW